VGISPTVAPRLSDFSGWLTLAARLRMDLRRGATDGRIRRFARRRSLGHRRRAVYGRNEQGKPGAPHHGRVARYAGASIITGSSGINGALLDWLRAERQGSEVARVDLAPFSNLPGWQTRLDRQE
jgi:hypothetical protein